MNSPKTDKNLTNCKKKLLNVHEPAHTIINKLGGVRAVSRALGISAAAVTRWQKDRERRGCGGAIPEFRRDELRALGRELGVRITKKAFEAV